MRLSFRKIEQMLSTPQGIQNLVSLGVGECDFLEFKRTINRMDPKWQAELRADCAALTTVGRGFLVVGVDDSRDGRDAASEVLGVSDAAGLKTAILHTLADGLSPPLKGRDVDVISIGDDREVLVVRMWGRKGYPITVTGNPPSRRHVVREGGRKNWLSDEKARLRRQELDVRHERMRLGLIFLMLSVVSGVVVFKLATDAASKMAIHVPRRSISPEQRRVFVERLARSPGPQVMINEVMADLESNLLARQIADALRSAGWVPVSSTVFGMEATGLHVLVRPGVDGSCVIPFDSAGYRLAYAIKELGQGVVIGCDKSISSDEPVLIVGRHPESLSGKLLLERMTLPEMDGMTLPEMIDGSGLPPPP